MAHQYLVKPSDADTLKGVIGRACALRDLLACENLKRLVSRVEALPSIPVIYARIMRLLDDPEISAQEIGNVISGDLGMTAKILQVVNSAFFGLPRRFADISQAVVYLGSDTIKSLALFGGMFSTFKSTSGSHFDGEALFLHSQQVSGIALKIARLERMEKKMTEDAILGGLLHDVGKLVIADSFPDVYRNLEPGACLNHSSMLSLEMEALGATHAEIGAYLMGLWGLPDPIVEAIAFHHHPSRCPAGRLDPMGIVHVADVLACGSRSEDGAGDFDGLDREFLERLRLTERLAIWEETAGALAGERLS